MPYAIHESDGKWLLIKKDTGEIVSHHDTKAKAEAAERAIYAHEHKGDHPWHRKLL